MQHVRGIGEQLGDLNEWKDDRVLSHLPNTDNAVPDTVPTDIQTQTTETHESEQEDGDDSPSYTPEEVLRQLARTLMKEKFARDNVGNSPAGQPRSSLPPDHPGVRQPDFGTRFNSSIRLAVL